MRWGDKLITCHCFPNALSFPVRAKSHMRRQVHSVLHIEDDTFWSSMVAQILAEKLPGAKIHSEQKGLDGIATARATRADLVLLDMSLPDIDGFEVADQLGKIPAPPPVILLSSRIDDAALYRAGLAPCCGFIAKNNQIENNLVLALEAIANGLPVYSPEARLAVRQMRSSPDAFYKILSLTELALMPYFGLGASDDEIAAEFDGNALTIRNHRRRIMAKLGLHRSISLIHWAIERGFVVVAPGCKPTLRRVTIPTR